MTREKKKKSRWNRSSWRARTHTSHHKFTSVAKKKIQTIPAIVGKLAYELVIKGSGKFLIVTPNEWIDKNKGTKHKHKFCIHCSRFFLAFSRLLVCLINSIRLYLFQYVHSTVTCGFPPPPFSLRSKDFPCCHSRIFFFIFCSLSFCFHSVKSDFSLLFELFFFPLSELPFSCFSPLSITNPTQVSIFFFCVLFVFA